MNEPKVIMNGPKVTMNPKYMIQSAKKQELHQRITIREI